MSTLKHDASLPAVQAARRTRGRSKHLAPWLRHRSPVFLVIRGIVLAFAVVAVAFPFLYVISLSFASNQDINSVNVFLFPQHPTLAAYRDIFRGSLVTHALLVSLYVTVVGTAISLVVTVTLAYALSRPGMPGRRVVLYLVLVTLVFSPGIIPSYLVVVNLGLLNNYFALMLPTALSAFNFVVMRNFFMNIPQELMDSAQLDGAGELALLTRIVLPLSKAVVSVIGLFYAVGLWGSYFSAILYLPDSSKWPIQLVLNEYLIQGTAIGQSTLGAVTSSQLQQALPPQKSLEMAILVVSIVPILIVYPFIQKHFTKGVLTGAIKG